jgi:hypothetical protein
MLILGTVMDIPFPIKVSGSSEDSTDLPYTILFDDGTTASIPLSQMAGLIPPPPITPSAADGDDSLLPPFLRLNSRITFKHKGQYHKGYLNQTNGVYQFSYKSQVNKRNKDWGVSLPNLPSTWIDICVEGTLIPGHVSHSFLWSPVSYTPTTFDPVASFFSAINLHWDCLPSLLKALADSHPNRELWLNSFLEIKRSIQQLDTYKKITLGEYRAIRKKGAPWVIPTMCVLTIKTDDNLCPLCTKSCIVVLGNHKECSWKKSRKFAPILRQDSLCFLTSMDVASCCPLRQGDCKNAFCQGILSPKKITIVCSPSGDPEAAPDKYWLLKQALYGLWRSPHHWYDKSVLSFDRLDSRVHLRIHLSILVSSATLPTLPTLWPISPRRLYPSVCTLTTLSISWKIPRLKPYSVILLLNITKSISWALLNGFLGFIFHGAPPLLQ